MNIETDALRYADQLGVGCVRSSLICPSCHGGQSGEKSFCVGREADKVWWKCFRASCGAAGATGSHRLGGRPRSSQLERIRPYTKPLLPLEEADRIYFRKRFDLELKALAGVMVTEDDRYALPYRDYVGRVRGYVVRQPFWKGNPRPPRTGIVSSTTKAVTYPHSTEPVAGWYRGSWTNAHAQVVVVEDQISAMRVAQAGPTCYALLGSSLNAEKVRDLYLKHPRGIILALDPDAQGMAQQMRLKWGGYFSKCRIVAMPQDPKDVPYDTLLEELGI